MREDLRRRIQEKYENRCHEAMEDFRMLYAQRSETEQNDRVLDLSQTCIRKQCYERKDKKDIQSCTIYSQDGDKLAKYDSGIFSMDIAREFIEEEKQRQNEKKCREAMKDFNRFYSGLPNICIKNKCYEEKDQLGIQSCTIIAENFELSAHGSGCYR